MIVDHPSLAFIQHEYLEDRLKKGKRPPTLTLYAMTRSVGKIKKGTKSFLRIYKITLNNHREGLEPNQIKISSIRNVGPATSGENTPEGYLKNSRQSSLARFLENPTNVELISNIEEFIGETNTFSVTPFGDTIKGYKLFVVKDVSIFTMTKAIVDCMLPRMFYGTLNFPESKTIIEDTNVRNYISHCLIPYEVRQELSIPDPIPINPRTELVIHKVKQALVHNLLLHSNY